jgi:hypothetical protein
MAFGQSSGPPATAKQVHELLTLLQQAGHRDFRDARGPLGFTQRQAAGKFSRDEAATFIEQLQDGEVEQTIAVPAAPLAGPFQAAEAMRDVPADRLAAELRRRGWLVVEP